MENVIVANINAQIGKVHVKVGDHVSSGQMLLEYLHDDIE
jgi:biotin carboxyl carrier protein